MKDKLKLFVFGVLASVVSLTLAKAIAHPQSKCFESELDKYCDYVQVDTPGGGVEMVYICE